MYETFDHTADLGLRVRADDLPALFAEAARGLFSLIVADPSTVRTRRTIALRLENEDREYLLFDWLNELLYAFESQRLLLWEFHVRIDGHVMDAEARGETWDPARHQLEHEVKAITYHGLRLEREADGWLAEVIVDI